MNKVSIIIPHYNNYSIINQCLKSLLEINYKNIEIIIIDNNSSDDSFLKIKNNYNNIILKKSHKNLGYAGGCNLGASFASGDYLLFLNNDTVHSKNFLNHLVATLDKDKNIASVQPKIKNLNRKDFFDYAGASGGYIDYLVFPFCRGRIFDTLEKDTSQYDENSNVFWTSGTAFLTRKSLFMKMNGFDQKLFAHMEEIDYCWKCNLSNYVCVVNPSAVIYHEGAKTLSYNSPMKTYLNHRNSLILLLTNYQFLTVIKVLPLRIILEIISSFRELLNFRFLHFIAHYLSLASILNFFYLLKRRRYINNIRVVGDEYLFKNDLIFSKSIIFEYFLKRKIFFKDLFD